MNMDNVGFKRGRVIFHGNNDSRHELKSSKPNKLGRNPPFAFNLKPPGKVKFWDPAEEDDARNPKVRKLLTHLLSQPSENKKLISLKTLSFASKEGDAQNENPTVTIFSGFCENDKLTSFKTKVAGRKCPSFASRTTGKVKFWDPTEDDDDKSPKVTTTVTVISGSLGNEKPITSKPKEMGYKNSPKGGAQKSKENNIVLSSKEQIRREKIQEAMSLFDVFHGELYEKNRLMPKGEKIAHWRVSFDAAKKVQQMLKWMDAKKTLGSICGVQVGDKFKYRSQLKMIGLHCQAHSGIDYTMIGGRNLAISIVDAHRYSNQTQSCDVLYYSGHGGMSFLGNNKQLPPEDQELKRGNLALKNSMIEKTPLRVIQKHHGVGNEDVFVYNGLYVVEDYTHRKVFTFKLRRKPGQPQLCQMLKW